MHNISESAQSYERDGYIWEDGVFSTAEVTRLREIIEVQDFANAYKAGEGTVHSLSLTAAHPELRALACDPRILAAIRPLLGHDIALQHSKLAAKPLKKGYGAFAWHQDFSYYPHSCTHLLSVMVMLDDADEENGCMMMVPGSHRFGLLPHEDRRGHFTGRCTGIPMWELPGAATAITPRAGGMSIHHALTLHGSPVNLSGRPRRGLVFSYRSAEAMQLADHVFPDTGLMVSGVRNGFVRCGEQRFRLPRWGGVEASKPHLGAWNQVGSNALLWNVENGLLPCGADTEKSARE